MFGILKDPQLLTANVMGVAFGAFILWIAYRVGRDDDSYLVNFLICAIGGLIGWVLGVLAAPLSNAEAVAFETYAKVFSVFASGYLVGKLDRFLESTLFDHNAPRVLGWIRSGLFVAALISVMVPTFVNRAHFHSLKYPDTTSPALSAKPGAGQAD